MTETVTNPVTGEPMQMPGQLVMNPTTGQILEIPQGNTRILEDVQKGGFTSSPSIEQMQQAGLLNASGNRVGSADLFAPVVVVPSIAQQNIVSDGSIDIDKAVRTYGAKAPDIVAGIAENPDEAKARTQALVDLAPYKRSDGYDITAARKANVPIETIEAAGFDKEKVAKVESGIKLEAQPSGQYLIDPTTDTIKLLKDPEDIKMFISEGWRSPTEAELKTYGIIGESGEYKGAPMVGATEITYDISKARTQLESGSGQFLFDPIGEEIRLLKDPEEAQMLIKEELWRSPTEQELKDYGIIGPEGQYQGAPIKGSFGAIYSKPKESIVSPTQETTEETTPEITNKDEIIKWLMDNADVSESTAEAIFKKQVEKGTLDQYIESIYSHNIKTAAIESGLSKEVVDKTYEESGADGLISLMGATQYESSMAQALSEQEIARFKEQNIEVAPDKWIDKTVWEGYNPKEQKAIKIALNYTADDLRRDLPGLESMTEQARAKAYADTKGMTDNEKYKIFGEGRVGLPSLDIVHPLPARTDEDKLTTEQQVDRYLDNLSPEQQQYLVDYYQQVLLEKELQPSALRELLYWVPILGTKQLIEERGYKSGYVVASMAFDAAIMYPSIKLVGAKTLEIAIPATRNSYRVLRNIARPLEEQVNTAILKYNKAIETAHLNLIASAEKIAPITGDNLTAAANVSRKLADIQQSGKNFSTAAISKYNKAIETAQIDLLASAERITPIRGDELTAAGSIAEKIEAAQRMGVTFSDAAIAKYNSIVETAQLDLMASAEKITPISGGDFTASADITKKLADIQRAGKKLSDAAIIKYNKIVETAQLNLLASAEKLAPIKGELTAAASVAEKLQIAQRAGIKFSDAAVAKYNQEIETAQLNLLATAEKFGPIKPRSITAAAEKLAMAEHIGKNFSTAAIIRYNKTIENARINLLAEAERIGSSERVKDALKAARKVLKDQKGSVRISINRDSSEVNEILKNNLAPQKELPSWTKQPAKGKVIVAPITRQQVDELIKQGLTEKEILEAADEAGDDILLFWDIIHRKLAARKASFGEWEKVLNEISEKADRVAELENKALTATQIERQAIIRELLEINTASAIKLANKLAEDTELSELTRQELSTKTSALEKTATQPMVKTITQMATKTATQTATQLATQVKALAATKVQPAIKTATQTATQTATAVKTAVKPAIQTATEVATAVKTATQTKTQTKTAIETKVATGVRTKTAIKTGITVKTPVTVKTDTGIKYRPILKPPILTQKDIDKRLQGGGGALGFYQGTLMQGNERKEVWYVVFHPFTSENDAIRLIGKLPEGITPVRKGEGASYRSIQMIAGKLPRKILLDLGIQDIEVTPSYGGRNVRINYHRDIKRRTKGDINLKNVRTISTTR